MEPLVIIIKCQTAVDVLLFRVQRMMIYMIYIR